MTRDDFNFCTLTDSYKLGHHGQYLFGTEYVNAYFESRYGAKWHDTVFYGLQYIMEKYMAGKVVTRDKIERAAKLSAAHMRNDQIFNRPMWEHLLNEHDGRLALRIKAVPEGTPVTVNNVLMQAINTDPACWALTNHSESLLSHAWYASTVCTLSRECKKLLQPFFELSVMPEGYAALDYMLHDFGFRGASSVESAGIGGSAHLVNFQGTDTLRALELIMDYYLTDECVGFSVPATEHSVMTAGGPRGEELVVRQLFGVHPTGILSIVADSYNIYNFCQNIIGGTFRETVLNRDGITVIRPDSGDPVKVMLECLNILWLKFGGKVNDKGFKELNPKIKVLWGDGLEIEDIGDLCTKITDAGWSMSCIATFGMGGGLLQKVNRDTQRFAFKCSAQERDGKWYDIWKDPLDKSKASKRGILALTKDHVGEWDTVKECGLDGRPDYLRTVFENGYMLNSSTFQEVRYRARLSL